METMLIPSVEAGAGVKSGGIDGGCGIEIAGVMKKGDGERAGIEAERGIESLIQDSKCQLPIPNQENKIDESRKRVSQEAEGTKWRSLNAQSNQTTRPNSSFPSRHPGLEKPT